MSLTLKRSCPFTLTIHQYNGCPSPKTLEMDPDPFATRYSELNYNEWTPVSPTTSQDVYPKTSSQRSPSPPKRPRNAKNLSLIVTPGSKTTTSLPISAPASPFRSPRLPTRRPSNLTINIHSLHRHPSTPELYSTMRTPLVSSPAPLTSNQFSRQDSDVRRLDPDRPKTRHTDPSFNNVPYEESIEREKAYPDGPRVILEPNIWLYAEPDLDLAKSYDVVINVAKEVGNPFLVTNTLDPSTLSPPYDSESTPSPFSQFSSETSPSVTSSTSSGLSIGSPRLSTKTSEPGAPTLFKYNNVEYMHVPWDHNSSLSQDLPGIVDYILERSAQGKKILVHCQCGVSRSATLVIAVVMKKLGMGTHEAYAYVKDRSPWIGPNMSLIYQLTDYGRLCGHEKPLKSKPSTPHSATLENRESQRYKQSPKTVHTRRSVIHSQNDDRHRLLDVQVDLVTETLSSPRFVVSDDKTKDG